MAAPASEEAASTPMAASPAVSPVSPPSAAASAKPPRAAWPGDRANPFSVLLLAWLDPLLWRGFRKPLDEDDTYAVPKLHSARSVRGRVEAVRAAYPDATFTSAILRTFVLRWLAGFCSKCVFVTAYLLQPFWVGSLITYINDRMLGRYTESSVYFWGFHKGLHLAAGLVVTSLVAILAVNHTFYHQTRYGTYLRTATLVFLYEKAMRLSPASRRQYTTGSIVTMMAVDAERIYQGVLTSQWVWAGPVVILVSMALTIKVLGLTGLVGAGVMVLAMLYQGQSASRSGVQREALVKLTDERLKLTNEVLQGIRIVKLYCWEKPIGEMIESVRGQEIVALTRMLVTKITAIVGLFLAPVAVSAATFTAYLLLEKDVSTERVFTALAFCNLIRLPMSSMPNAISNLSDFFIAVKRVNRFMQEKELPPPAQMTSEEQQLPRGAIRLEHASFSWDADGGLSDGAAQTQTQTTPTLQDVSLDIQPGQLVIVVGSCGAGKSSLVAALLGELPCVGGRRAVNGKVALVAQEAWVQNKTVRDGILFGRPYDRPLYRAVLKAAQLKTDLEMLSARDHTEIGERGVSLSGGQKARVSLARALYDDADIVLLDDPLAAVDAHVTKALFDTAITGVLHDKTRILVLSSNYHLLAQADQVVVMEGGRVLGVGTYQELLPRFPRFFDTGNGGSSPNPPPQQEGQGQGAQERSLALSPIPGRHVVTLEELGKSARLDKMESMPVLGGDKAAALMEKEDRETGSVSSAIYLEYFAGATETRWGGALLGLGIVFVFGLAQACRVMLDLWLTKMAEALSGDDPERAHPAAWWLGIYWTFAVLTVGLSIFRSRLVLCVAIRSCSNLHKRLLHGVLRAPVNTYFDVTPLGRILNRFSKDMDHVDQGLPDTLLQLLQNGIFLLSILALCVSSSPWFILLFLPILALFYVLYTFFRRTSREVKRLEGVSRSPIYSSFTETLQGIVNIRAFRRSQDFLDRHYGAVDDNTSSFLLFWFCSRWLAIRLDMLSTGVMAILAFLGVIVADQGVVGGSAAFSPSLLGLSLIYGLQLTGLLQWTIRLVVECENNFTSVERLVSFLSLPEEAPEVTDARPPSDWPSRGAIEVEGVKLAYRPGLPLVLKGLDLTVRGGEKVGIVGRTGAGKSSLGQALFRLVELQDGAIRIDGVDIKSIGLGDLRSRLTVIPQDPVLFSGSLRFNLDPFNACADAEIWEALRRVYLDKDVQALPQKLDAAVLEGGGNFSVGQRQLICICRALLRKSRILLMDEATACVDSETDRRIQETIRTNFGHCTILTVAHRIATIIDFDRIAVLDRGRCLENGSPYELLQEGGAFAGLVAELGPETAATLTEVARTAAAGSWGGEWEKGGRGDKKDQDVASPVAVGAAGGGPAGDRKALGAA